MSTVQKIRSAVQYLQQTYIAKGKARRFACGVAALSLEAFESLNAAGRGLGLNRFTGENRIRRLVTDTTLADQLQQLLVSEALGSRSGYFYCSLDHSQFGPFCIAVLAVSVRKGRAIPVWCQVNVSEAALAAPLLTALETLFEFISFVAPKLKLVLVMDRWFASDKLFKLFAKYDTYFIARTKSDKLVQLPWDPSWWKEPIGDISHRELVVAYRKHKLRLVRSDFKDGIKGGEPWFLLTNLPEEITRRQVLNRYAERFEIEESFKDVKWLNRLEWQRVRKPEVIRTLLLFVFLGWWLVWRYVAPSITKQTPQTKLHPKKRLSWFRLAWEELQRLLRTPLLPPVAVLRGGEEK
ncbi:MAG TPA: transposase [Candidatus Saccharimonadales bacterium]|nr:transposase [Candidatus Saccharimonadales bacterium]